MGRGASIFSISSAIALASKIPTQIGITASDPMSFSTTIGMFVAGSIIRPRIRTSMSIASPGLKPSVLDGFSHKTVRKSSRDLDFKVTSGCRCDWLGAGEIDGLVLTATPGNLPSCGVGTLNHYLNYLPDL